MKKKDIMFICAMANALLLCALFVVGIMTPERKIDLVDAIDKTKPAMLQVKPILADEEGRPSSLIETKDVIVYQLPKIQSEKVEPIEVPKQPEKIVVVKKRDTLEAIARREKTSVERIIALNDLKSPLLKIGQNLKMPLEQTVGSTTKSIEKVPVAPPVKSTPKNNSEKYYTVIVGDNPWTIAMKHHMKVTDLLEINSLDNKSARKIKPGDKLRVR